MKIQLFCTQALFNDVVALVENGGVKRIKVSQLSYTKDQIDAIQKLKNSKDDHQRLGLTSDATMYVKFQINKQI